MIVENEIFLDMTPKKTLAAVSCRQHRGHSAKKPVFRNDTGNLSVALHSYNYMRRLVT